jgi:NDP-sugar pyrophosphorylase family protein
MDASLLVLAAGMGSRYGGLKQMDDFGPNGETIIDYSIYDAINAGFNKIVFVIRKSFRNDFESFFRDRIGDRVQLEFVEQELFKLPAGYQLNPEREKPWGTAHAVMMGAEVIEEDFAVINADDYYGKASYKTLIDYFKSNTRDDEFAVVSYLLKNTLSDHGTVNRGVCFKDKEDYLTHIIETLKISRNDDGVISYPSSGGPQYLESDTLVSMNMFGFNPKYFQLAEKHFKDFLDAHGQELRSEYFIPYSLDQMIANDEAKVKVLTSPANWFGVTYKEDKPIVVNKIKALIEAGVYPSRLWD